MDPPLSTSLLFLSLIANSSWGGMKKICDCEDFNLFLEAKDLGDLGSSFFVNR